MRSARALQTRSIHAPAWWSQAARPVSASAPCALLLPQSRRPTIGVPLGRRSYASGGSLGREEIQERIVDVLKSFEKVDPAKVLLPLSLLSLLPRLGRILTRRDV